MSLLLLVYRYGMSLEPISHRVCWRRMVSHAACTKTPTLPCGGCKDIAYLMWSRS